MQIKIYIAPACPWCKKLKDWLKRKRIPFEECDVSESQNGRFRDELIEKTGQLAVPVADINGEISIGFNEQKLEETIKKFSNKKTKG